MILRLSLPRLYSLLLHAKRPVYAVQFKVESAGVAHWLAVVVPPPEGRVARLAIGALNPGPSYTRRGNGLLRFAASHGRPVHSVHLVVDAIVTVATASFVPSPGGGRDPAAEALFGIGDDRPVESGLLAAGERQIRPRRRGDGGGAPGRDAVRPAGIQLYVGRVADGDGRHVLIARDAVERRR